MMRILALLFIASGVFADDFRPLYVELTELETYRIES